jgi:hypothetical protein
MYNDNGGIFYTYGTSYARNGVFEEWNKCPEMGYERMDQSVQQEEEMTKWPMRCSSNF